MLNEDEKQETVAHAYDLHYRQVKIQYSQMIRELALVLKESIQNIEDRIMVLKVERRNSVGNG